MVTISICNTGWRWNIIENTPKRLKLTVMEGSSRPIRSEHLFESYLTSTVETVYRFLRFASYCAAVAPGIDLNYFNNLADGLDRSHIGKMFERLSQKDFRYLTILWQKWTVRQSGRSLKSLLMSKLTTFKTNVNFQENRLCSKDRPLLRPSMWSVMNDRHRPWTHDSVKTYWSSQNVHLEFKGTPFWLEFTRPLEGFCRDPRTEPPGSEPDHQVPAPSGPVAWIPWLESSGRMFDSHSTIW